MSRVSAGEPVARRLLVLKAGLWMALLGILGRLFFWQIIQAPNLKTQATDQYQQSLSLTPPRGEIFFSDDYLLVGNEKVYRLFLEPSLLDQEVDRVSQQLLPIILAESRDYQEASSEAERQTLAETVETDLRQKLERSDSKWVNLKNKLSAQAKQQIEALHIAGLGFEEYLVRFYPEASMAAHVTGFLGKDEAGQDMGYFGIEGGLEAELRGFQANYFRLKDALGFNLLTIGKNNTSNAIYKGRDVRLTLRRDIQLIAEETLQKGLDRYGAAQGEIIIMEPQTGKILGWATSPKFDQKTFYEFDPQFYKNPSLSNLYEPGSTFKILTVAAGIESGVITPETICDNCAGPREIGKYTIRTWNDEYHPNISMTEALAKSDNVAMIFVAEKLGQEKFVEYLEKFMVHKKIGLELQEDEDTAELEKWGPVELATRSFGQGITLNSLQLLRAVNSLANHGQLVQPMIVASVFDPVSQHSIEVAPIYLEQVVSSQTADQVTRMMVYAAQKGEAQWTYRQNYSVAGKTGTSQIAGQGGYLEDKTIVSYVGFAPAENPKFIMLVKLTEPSSSPWAAETAAPLWYQVADKLILLL